MMGKLKLIFNPGLFARFHKLVQIMFDPMLFAALFKGVAAGVEHKLFLQGLECTCVVDVGANRGQFSLISRKIFPTARIIAFEPLDEPANIFRKVFDRDDLVILYPFAVGSEKSSSTIHISSEDDSSSLLPITQTQTLLFPNTFEEKTREVSVVTLSQVLGPETFSPFSLLKIDVQGYELEVLKGCKDLLENFSYIYVECSFVELYENQPLADQVISWLDKENFVFSGIYNVSYDRNGNAIQADFFFKRTVIREGFET